MLTYRIARYNTKRGFKQLLPEVYDTEEDARSAAQELIRLSVFGDFPYSIESMEDYG